MKSRDWLLNNIDAGDFVFAVADDGSPKILLVYRTTRKRIFARLITSQTKIELGRNGKSSSVEGGHYTCKIISVRPLPPHAYAIARGLDRKMRLGQPPDGYMLSKAEQQFLLQAGDYYRARPLSEADPMRFPREGDKPASFELGPPAAD
jgi:hypothetical protein